MQYVAAAIEAARTSTQFNAAVEAFLRTPVSTPSALARSITVLFRKKSRAEALRLLEITPFTETLFKNLFPFTRSLDWTHRLTLRTALATSIRDAVRADDDDYDDDEEKNGRIKALILASSDRSIQEAEAAEADATAEAEAEADEEEAQPVVKSESDFDSDSDSDSDYTDSSDESDEFSNARVIQRVMSPGPRYSARPVRTSSASLQTHRQSLAVPPIHVLSHPPPDPPRHPLDTIDATTVDMFDQRHAMYMRQLWRMRADFIESDEFTRRPSEDATKLLAALDHLLSQEGRITLANDHVKDEEQEQEGNIETGSVLLAFVAIVMLI